MQPLSLADFIGSADVVADPFLSQIYPSIAGAISPALYYAAILYWALLGYKVYAGYAALDMRDLLAKITMTFAVFGSLHWSGFATQIYHLFLSLMESTAALITMGDSSVGLLDRFLKNAHQISQTLLNNSLYQINAIIEGTLILMVSCLLFAITLLYLTISKIGLAITMTLLPIFIGFALFRETRPWFMNWLGTMLNFSFIYILMNAVIKLVFTAFGNNTVDIDDAASHFETNMVSGDVVAHLLSVQLVLIFFILQVKGWAANLSGSATSQGSSAILMLADVVRSAHGRGE